MQHVLKLLLAEIVIRCVIRCAQQHARGARGAVAKFEAASKRRADSKNLEIRKFELNGRILAIGN